MDLDRSVPLLSRAAALYCEALRSGERLVDDANSERSADCGGFSLDDGMSKAAVCAN